MVSGIGIDVVNIERIERLSESVRKKLFHHLELDEASQLNPAMQSQFLAGRFAAKEALGKALGTGLKHLSLKDIWVERGDAGEPVLHFSGKAEQLVGNRKVFISISHDAPVAVAMVVLSGGADGPL